MLARIYGIFSITTPLFQKVDVIIMENTSKLYSKKQMKYKFDLKGSFVGRRVSFNSTKACNLIRSKNKDYGTIYSQVLKDRNLCELNQGYKQFNKNVVNLDTQDEFSLIEVLESDSKFLKEHNLMDYSLYIAVENCN